MGNENMVNKLMEKAGKRYVLKGKLAVGILGSIEFEVHSNNPDTILNDYKDFEAELKAESKEKSIF